MAPPERSGAAEIQGEEAKRRTPTGDIEVCRRVGSLTRRGGSCGEKRALMAGRVAVLDPETR